MATIRDSSGKSIDDYKKAYAEASARGDAAGMKAANDAANAIRASNGQAAEVASKDIARVAGAGSGTAAGQAQKPVSTPSASQPTPTVSRPTAAPTAGSGRAAGGGVDWSLTWDTLVAQGAGYEDLKRVAEEREKKASTTPGLEQYIGDAKQKEMEAYLAGMRPQQPSSGSSGVNDYSDYIQAMNKAQKEAALSALRAAYEKNVAGLARTQAGIAPGYQNARNQAAGQSEQQKRAFAEYAAAHGLNSGAGGQAMLAMGNALQNNLSGIAQAEASTMADLELQRSQMESDYNNAIAQAEAQGNYKLAQQLYQEKVRQDEALREQMQWQAQMELQRQQMQFQQEQAGIGNSQWERQFQAGMEQYNQEWAHKQAQELAQQYGDFSGYKALGYSDEQIQKMKDTYEYQRQFAYQQEQKKYGNASSTAKKEPEFYDPGALFQAAYESGMGETYLLMNAGKYGVPTGQMEALTAQYLDWAAAQGQGAAIKDYSQLGPAAKNIANNLAKSYGKPQNNVTYIKEAEERGSITAQEADFLLRSIGAL